MALTVPFTVNFTLPFTKMQGLGNDFIVIDDLGPKPATEFPITPALAQKICDRRFGVGADQILWLKKPHDAALDVRMEILNADGSVAEMCGNGIRAIALYIDRYHGPRKPQYLVETLAGIKIVQLRGDGVIVDMGLADLGPGFASGGESLLVQGEELRFYEVNVGNPHAVFFVKNVDQFPVAEIGPLVERHPRFPQRTNVEFVEVLSPHAIRVKVWERGAGITLACGTGACAAAVASLATSRVEGEISVELPGGNLKIGWKGPSASVMMEGPAKEVFQGAFLIEKA